MSTLQNILCRLHRVRARPGIALTALIAIGLSLPILVTTSHRASAATTSKTARPGSQATALTAPSLLPAGCYRDPTMDSLTCVLLRHRANRIDPAQTTTFYATDD